MFNILPILNFKDFSYCCNFEHNYLEIAESKYDIQIDFDIQFDVSNHNHNVSLKMSQHKSLSTVNRKLVNDNGQKYKVRRTKSRSLTG